MPKWAWVHESQFDMTLFESMEHLADQPDYVDQIDSEVIADYS
jgi:hypothetical protein